MELRAVCVSACVLLAGCPSKSGPSAPTPPSAGDTAAMCGDLEALATAAAANFDEQRGTDPVERDGLSGVASLRGIAGTERCAILRPDPAYPDDMLECELAAPGPRAATDATLAAWQPRVASCAVVTGWASKPLGSGHSWAQETEDNHLLEIQLDVIDAGATATPVIRVRRPEI